MNLPLYPIADKLFTPGTQNHQIYTALLQGPVTNATMAHGMFILNYKGRMFEIREKLRPYFLTVHAERLTPNRGIFDYSLRRIEAQEVLPL